MDIQIVNENIVGNNKRLNNTRHDEEESNVVEFHHNYTNFKTFVQKKDASLKITNSFHLLSTYRKRETY